MILKTAALLMFISQASKKTIKKHGWDKIVTDTITSAWAGSPQGILHQTRASA